MVALSMPQVLARCCHAVTASHALLLHQLTLATAYCMVYDQLLQEQPAAAAAAALEPRPPLLHFVVWTVQLPAAAAAAAAVATAVIRVLPGNASLPHSSLYCLAVVVPPGSAARAVVLPAAALG
jgi:hypothetical protein